MQTSHYRFVAPALARRDIGARLSVRPFIIYLDRRSLVHSNDLFPKTNAPMVLKGQGSRRDKIGPVTKINEIWQYCMCMSSVTENDSF